MFGNNQAVFLGTKNYPSTEKLGEIELNVVHTNAVVVVLDIRGDSWYSENLE